MPTSDEITLTLPRDREFHRIAHLVLGGLALRLELTIETLRIFSSRCRPSSIVPGQRAR